MASVCRLTIDRNVAFLLLLFLCSVYEIVMADFKKLTLCLKCYSLLEKSATESYQMLHQAFKEVTQVFEWLGRFNNDEMSVEDHACSGHHSTSQSDENI